ncbi:hypothetical protein [Bradyrhizobium japonicum]|uniref:hypothetical protein n=1 Tax=Bradyrhizobium japonicum TaxID=375 RepID=UPI00117E56B8|nr:hypothetical protein [Bradyrhizobium japonicum]
MKTITDRILAAAPVAADPCVWGTNRPGSDVNPAKRIDEKAPQMLWEHKTIERVGADGQVRTRRPGISRSRSDRLPNILVIFRRNGPVAQYTGHVGRYSAC